MRIERIRLKNFKAFRDAELREIPGMCVLVGANGTGKSTLFSVFGFLKDALADNVTVALAKLGGRGGFQEVRTRCETGPIEIEFKFRHQPDTPLITYLLVISERDGVPVVEKEVLKYRHGNKGQHWHFLDFRLGKGEAIINETDKPTTLSDLRKEEHILRSPDILALKVLSQLERFPTCKLIGEYIESWHVSDFNLQRMRPERELGYAEHLDREGDNLALVADLLYKKHPDIFRKIIEVLKWCVPGLAEVDAKITDYGRILLRFKDRTFDDPFLARYASDGTLTMFAFLVLLYDPKPHPLLCVEEPENQLYFTFLTLLAEKFRAYSKRGSQVFVSTHSSAFLNACELEEVYWLVKKDGYSTIMPAQDNAQVKVYMDNGAQMGYLWSEGFFFGVDPE